VAITQTELHQMYLAYFGRPADFNGMIFYTSNPAQTRDTTAESFSNSDESKALYGENFGADTINKIYLNLFGRDAEVEGLIYWMTEVNSGRLSPAMAAWAILVGAQENDKIVVDKKMAVAQAFFDALNTTPEILGYGGAEDALAAFGFLADIDVDTDLDDKLAEVAAFVASITNTTPPTPPLGTPTAEPEEPLAELPDLEDAIDFTDGTTADNLTGTKAADTFFAIIGGDDATGTAGDKADGGEEADTLILQIEGSTKDAVPATFTTKGIETIRIRNLSGKDQTIDATKFEGATVFVGDYSTGRVHVTNMAATQAGSTLVNASHHNALLSFEYATGVTAAALELQGAKDDVVQIGGAAVTATTVTTHAADEGTTLAHLVLTGANNKSLTIDASETDIEIRHLHAIAGTEVVLVSEALQDSEAAPGNIVLGDLIGVTKVDASEVQGAVEVHGDPNATFAANFTYLGGEGDDTYHVRGALTGGEIDGGESDGEHDTLYIHGAFVTSQAQADRYKNFEGIVVSDGVSQNASFFAAATDLAISDGEADAGTHLTHVTLSQAEVGITLLAAHGDKGAISIGVDGASDDDDVLTLNLADGPDGELATFNLGNLAVANIESLNIRASANDLVITSLVGLTHLTGIAAEGTGTASITTGAINLGASGNTLNFATMEGAVTINASAAQASAASGLSITGSATAANTIHDSVKADTITGGAASDTVTYQGGADEVALEDGGDLFNFNGKSGAALGDGVVFSILNNDEEVHSHGKAQVEGGSAFLAHSDYDAALTDSIEGISTTVQNTRFVIEGFGNENDEFSFETATTLNFDNNNVGGAGGWLLVDLEDGDSNTVYLFRDSNGDAAIQRSDMMIRLVGTGEFNLGDFFVDGTDLVYRMGSD
jgi:trimeric autotransporter adhesin